MKFLDTEIAPLGMGCWPIGGAMFHGTDALGYTKADDTESIRTIHAALAGGITVFDTAAAYGAGHAERLLAKALKNRPDALIVTKIGIEVDEQSKQLSFGTIGPDRVQSEIDRCLSRLEREHIDLLLLHENELPVVQAKDIFEQMEKARAAGKIRAYGWSTDFSQRAAAFADKQGFVAIEHAMNVLVDAPRIQRRAQENGLITLIRSPLGMGLLSGKYQSGSVMPSDDIRANPKSTAIYFKNAKPNAEHLNQLNAIKDLLTVDGRNLVQGALGWLWAKGHMNIPVPGARTVGQMEDLTSALDYGALPLNVMAEIETLMARPEHTTPEVAL